MESVWVRTQWRREEPADTSHGAHLHSLRRYLHAARHRGRHLAPERIHVLAGLQQRAAVLRFWIGAAEAERPCTRHQQEDEAAEAEGSGRLVRPQRQLARPLGCGEICAVSKSSLFAHTHTHTQSSLRRVNACVCFTVWPTKSVLICVCWLSLPTQRQFTCPVSAKKYLILEEKLQGCNGGKKKKPAEESWKCVL